MLNGVPITYTRGSTTIKNLCAVQGSTSWDEVDVASLVTNTARRHDWIFKACFISKTLGTPQEGDFITHKSKRYNIMRGTPGEQPWRYADRGELWMRVHTVETGVPA